MHNIKIPKNYFYEENIMNDDTEIISEAEILNNNLYKIEEDIIDDLTNSRIQNNICCLKKEDINKNSPIRPNNYKVKSKIKCYSADGKRPKTTKLKEWLNNNIENTKKIKEYIEDLILEIFVTRYNSYPNKNLPLSQNALQTKKQIEIFCPKLYEFSLYILILLHKKFYSFFYYLSKKINFKTLPLNELEKIKEILFYTGIDLKIVFKKTFEKTCNFNLSNILVVMFDEYLIKDNIINENFNIKNSSFYKEKEKFENYIIKVKQNLYFFEIDTQTDINEENIKNNNNLFNNENNTKIVKEQNSLNSIKKDNDINTELMTNIEKENNMNNDNNIKKENIENNDKYKDSKNNTKNSFDKTGHIKNKNVDNKENNNLIDNLNIDDLVNYINDSGNEHKKKRKKRRKEKKKENNIIKIKENQENINVEDDLVFLNYKQSLEEFTKNLLIKEKIKPKYSEAFLKKLQILSNSL